MRRRCLNILSAISLLLFLATCSWWARSHIVVETGLWMPGACEYSVHTGRGEIVFGRRDQFVYSYSDGRDWLYLRYPAATFPNGAAYGHRGYGADGFLIRWGPDHFAGHVLVVPLWLLACLFSLLPLRVLYVQWQLRKSRLVGCCSNCRYDLRASKDRFPECGTLIPTQATNGGL